MIKRLIRPTDKDFSYHCEQIKRAFDRVPNAKAEWKQCIESVKHGEASFYLFKKSGVFFRFVGVAEGETYFFWAVEGKGYRALFDDLRELLRSCGYKRVRVHTFKKAMARYHKMQGFDQAEAIEHNKSTEYILTLEI